MKELETGRHTRECFMLGLMASGQSCRNTRGQSKGSGSKWRELSKSLCLDFSWWKKSGGLSFLAFGDKHVSFFPSQGLNTSPRRIL